MSVDVTDINRLIARIDRAPYAVLRQVIAVTTKATADTDRDGKAFCPVDTGNLWSSIGHEVSVSGHGVLGEVGPTASYGRFVEDGTSRMAPHAYMGPAFDRHAYAFERAMLKLSGADL